MGWRRYPDHAKRGRACKTTHVYEYENYLTTKQIIMIATYPLWEPSFPVYVVIAQSSSLSLAVVGHNLFLLVYDDF